MQQFVDRLGWVLVHSLWEFALVAFLAGLTVRAMRRCSAAARYVVLAGALAGAVVAPVVTWVVLPDFDNARELASRGALVPGRVDNDIEAETPGADASRLADETRRERMRRDRRLERVHSMSSTDGSDASLVDGDSVPTGAGNTTAVGTVSQPTTEAEAGWTERVSVWLRPWLAWIVVGWSLGVVLCSLRPLFGWFTLWRLKRVGISAASDEVVATLSRVSQRLGLRRAVSVWHSTLAQVPIVVGYFKPVILLPLSVATSIPNAQLEAILAHELAHVRRHDFVVNLLQTLVETLCFYHPAVWWLSRQIRIEREHCCDDLVVRVLGNRVEYGRALIAIEELRGRGTLLALGVNDGSLLSRIRRLANGGSSRSEEDRSPAALVSIAMFCAACALAMTWSLVASDEPAKIDLKVESRPAADSPEPVSSRAPAGEWPMFGGSPVRNHVASGKLPTDWDIESRRNVAWSVKLGTVAYSSPVVSGGKVFVGTNNGAGHDPRRPKEQDYSCLICFNAATGQRLWQYASEKLPVGREHDWPNIGLCSTACVVSDRVFVVTNRCEVVCLDANGFRDGKNDGAVVDEPEQTEVDADVVWKFDMSKTLGVRPLHQPVSSIAVVDGLVLLNTSNAPDETQKYVPNLKAPHFLALDAKSGQVVWQDNSSGESIIVGGSSCGCSGTSPAVATIGGVTQAIFAGREGWLYGFDFADLKRGKTSRLWQFDCNPKTSIHLLSGRSTRNTLVASPVIVGDRVFIATGRNPELGEGPGDLWCIDATKRGDLSTELVFNKSHRNGEEPIPHKPLRACDPSVGDFTRPNPNSGAVWHYTGTARKGDQKPKFEGSFHRTMGTPTIHDGLLFVADFSGLLHCVDAETGQGLWTHDLLAACWSSCVIADGHVLIGDEDGDVAILKAARQCEPIRQEPLNLNHSISATPALVNDTLFVATQYELFAIREGKTDGLLGQMIEKPSVELLRELLARGETKYPEPIELLDDGRRGQAKKGPHVVVGTNRQDRFAVVAARVQPAIDLAAILRDEDVRVECAFVFDWQGRLIATLGGEMRKARGNSISMDDVDVLRLGPEEDWFVRVMNYRDEEPLIAQTAYYRIANPVVPSLRYFHYSNSNAWSFGPEERTSRFGTLFFDFPRTSDKFKDREASSTVDGVSVNREILWDGDRNLFVGASAQRAKNMPLYQVDTAWSKEFEPLAPKRDQLIVTGGMDERADWRHAGNWSAVVPSGFEAVIKLTIPQRDGPPNVVERRLGAGLAHLSVKTDPHASAATSRVRLWISGKEESFDMPFELGNSPEPQPVVRLLNPGNAAPLMNRPLKASQEPLRFEIKLLAKELSPAQSSRSQAEPRNEKIEFVTLVVGQRRVMEFERPVTRIEDFSNKLLTVKTESPQKLELIGQKVGITVLTVTDQAETELFMPVEIIDAKDARADGVGNHVMKPTPRKNPFAPRPIVDAKHSVALFKGMTQSLDFSTKAKRVTGFNPKIVEVDAMRPDRLRLQGESVGKTSLLVVLENDQRHQIDVEVSAPTRENVLTLIQEAVQKLGAVKRTPLKLTLHVVDSATHKPIKNPKAVFSFKERRWWEAAPKLKTEDGLLRWEGARDEAFQWRVMAKGYRPAITRLITLDEKEVTFDVPLERDPGISGRVMSADGQPVAGAMVRLTTLRSEAHVRRGELVWHKPLPGFQFHSVETDFTGNFTLPAEIDPYAIVVTSKEHGFAAMTEKAVVDRSNVTVSLQKWMRLEGTLQRSGKPLNGELVLVPYSRELRDSRLEVRFDEDATTGDDGRFIIERVEPGRVPIAPWKQQYEPSGVSRSAVGMFHVEGRPGQVIRFTIGHQQRAAVGRLKVLGLENEPAGPTPDWSRYRLTIEEDSRIEGQKRHREVKLESDGRFRIEQIQASDYSTKLERIGDDPADRQWVYWTHGIEIPLCDESEKDRLVELGEVAVYSRLRQKDARPEPETGKLLPQSKESRALFERWERTARANGNIPGGTIGPLVRVMRNFVKNNPIHEGAPKFAELLKRVDVTRDWSHEEAVKLLDEVAGIYASLPEWVLGENRFRLGGDVVAGKPLPEELKNVPWGEAQPNGLRVAWLLEPRALKYRLNTPLKSRLLFHNSGKNAVVFRALTWNQSGGHKAHDANGQDINIVSTYWTTIPMVFACRLAPGEFLEVNAAGIGIGANKDEEDWRDARSQVRVGAWIGAKAGDEVTFLPDAVHCDARDSGQPEGEEVATPENWWLKFIANRLSLDAPLPADAAERKRLLDRATRDLFGNAPTPEEITAFTTDSAADALDALVKRLASRPGFETFSGSLKSGTRKFLVLPVDPEAAKKPRSAKGPGQYPLGGNVTFVVTRRPIGERIVNEAHLSFSSTDATKPAPREPHPVPLLDDYDSWIAAWMRGGTVLWIAQKGDEQKEGDGKKTSIRRIEFTDPASVKETVITDPKPNESLPKAVLEVLQSALERSQAAEK